MQKKRHFSLCVPRPAATQLLVAAVRNLPANMDCTRPLSLPDNLPESSSCIMAYGLRGSFTQLLQVNVLEGLLAILHPLVDSMDKQWSWNNWTLSLIFLKFDLYIKSKDGRFLNVSFKCCKVLTTFCRRSSHVFFLARWNSKKTK